MKVIGKTASGYLVEATEEELAAVCGVDKWDAPWRVGNRHTDGLLKVGTDINVSARHARLVAIERAEKQVHEAADTLQSMAKLASRMIPSAIVPPPEPEPAPPAEPSDG